MKVSYVDVCFHVDDLRHGDDRNQDYVDWLPACCEFLDLADHKLETPSHSHTHKHTAVNVNQQLHSTGGKRQCWQQCSGTQHILDDTASCCHKSVSIDILR